MEVVVIGHIMMVGLVNELDIHELVIQEVVVNHGMNTKL
jgi:hypothetical protein